MGDDDLDLFGGDSQAIDNAEHVGVSQILQTGMGGAELSQEMKTILKQGRRCFGSLDRLTSLQLTYPPGHPVVEEAAVSSHQMFFQLFEITDRISVMIFSHTMRLLGTDEVVWYTEDPRDYCWVLSRDGVYLVHILAGITVEEIRQFVDILNDLVDESDLTIDAVSILFEAQLKYVSYDAIDESMAQLLNLELDLRDRDTKEEQELIEELLDELYDKENKEKLTPEQAAAKQAEEFQARMEKRAERQKRFEVGSREFLMLSDEQQAHLLELKRGFSDHAELEHREGEILAAILGAHPKPGLRDLSVEQIAEVMGTLLGTQEPWECLNFLKLIHQWRDGFDDATTDQLKLVVTQCFTRKRIALLIKLVARGDGPSRRSILQMFNALHLDDVNRDVLLLLGWGLEEETQDDLAAYLKQRTRFGMQWLMDGILELPAENTGRLIEIAKENMPRSRPIFLKILQTPVDPSLKAAAISGMAGHIKPEEAKRYLSPLLRGGNPKTRIVALRCLSDTAPKMVPATVAPLMNVEKLKDRPEEEVRELATLFVKYGGENAVRKLKEMIHVGKLSGEKERELALMLVKILARDATPVSIAILAETAKDWKLHNQVRQAAKELVEILTKA
jgi:hypothetical protein